jgi:hypothetical protein
MIMKSKYGEMPNEAIISSLDRLIAKVFKALPLREEGCETLVEYLEGLVRELIGVTEVVSKLKNHGEFLSVIGTIQSLINQDDFKTYRKDVLKCVNLVRKIKNELEQV